MCIAMAAACLWLWHSIEKQPKFYAENLALKLGLAAVVRNYVWGWAIAETSFGGLSDGDYSSQFLSETALVQINWGYWDPNANDDYLTDELTYSALSSFYIL